MKDMRNPEIYLSEKWYIKVYKNCPSLLQNPSQNNTKMV